MSITAAPVIDIRDLRKSYDRVTALPGISLRIGAGQRIALLGPNGAGKTTLIRILAGRTRPDAGTIRLLGRAIDEPGARAALGIVPQEIALYGDLTVGENLSAFGRYSGLRRGELKQRVGWALEWTGLAKRSRDLVAKLSGGMKRRVNLACSVLHRPAVLLLDEPTEGVDPQSRQRIFAMLDQLGDQGTTIVWTTHHLEEAEQRCDRIVILDRGRMIADGSLDELVDRTVGRSRLLRLRIDRPLVQPIELSGPSGKSIGLPGEKVITTRIDHVAGQLSAVVESARRSGYEVSDVELQSPSLHHVFLHLTGYSLRD